MLLGPAGEGPGPRRFSSLRGIVFAILLRGEGATLVIVLLRMPVPSLLRAEVPVFGEQRSFHELRFGGCWETVEQEFGCPKRP
ncbi:hypothetical protein F2Q69_00034190 [Brassica cretica]|uniref:Uncharacterized protein n=1 Tax=Brassica cretica TaxID=69181 RepID=A0A8S9SKL9_BRACR|nr:hypothetical protein F2Q69_00034190 [Brassica cretica]